MVIYVSDNYADVGTFPRFYLTADERYFLRFRVRKTVLVPDGVCSTAPEDQGRAACYVRQWLRIRLLDPHNCTVFYLRHKNPEYEVCDPMAVVTDYRSVADSALHAFNGPKVGL